jgi:fumarate reductase subunit D
VSARGRRSWDFERWGEPMASREIFRRRLFTSGAMAGSLLGFSLVLGILGYHFLVGIPDWLDCLLSASMIMGGMGPVGDMPVTPAGKLFASFYALYCGVVLLVSVGLLLSPAIHRLLHRFHVETEE